ncbi:MAG: radical SAM protein [Paludibacter sp.]|nr:radical SAM protein [Bacteroidales bacterium]MCM1068647.1 radical SAM protein [Prevotella sp.]MCM1353311.1 radical SAM protein [Bacteroides sp.]MCM1442281.1 radical SAM protein [Muribaculum sp.]MCM1481100.1 radical SAM protein [Paludibacter sp.]
MLFTETVYGPIHSRRLGISLGINLMPNNAKLCSFNCIYCECGFNTPIYAPLLPQRKDVYRALESKLQHLQQENITPDVITFSGNGEPTLHPEFEGIIADTCALRNRYFPTAKVSVLSNSTQLVRPDVVRALRQADNRILKLDSAIDDTMRLIDQPVNENLCVADIIALLQQFEGQFTLQTCFLKGEYQGHHIDNTTPEELAAWYNVVNALRPQHIMIYVIDRATPAENLQKIAPDTMYAIAQQLEDNGFNVSVSC